LPRAASLAKGSTEVKAKTIATNIDIAICAIKDAGVGSCSLLGFKNSLGPEICGSRLSSGWESRMGEFNEDLAS
jgi:hypothetical protein